MLINKRIQSCWSRLAAMNRQELMDRTREELDKRCDALRYHLGSNFATGQLRLNSRTSSKFFFGSGDVPPLAMRLREHLPQETAQIVESAERICRHRFDLLGYEDLDYGADIDWHCDRVHGKRAPRKLWFKIPYLDFAEVGDSKVTWELSRLQHFVTLAKAYRLTGDERFAVEIFRQWRHWHAENPCPIGINWASSLEVAFRSLSWIWMYFLLGECSVAPPGFRDEWLRALSINGRHIERYLSTYFSPNTHLLGEGVALFFIGTLCPELPTAERWKRRGWEIVLRESSLQVQADGMHFEQSIYYHVYALDFFLHARILASINDIPIPVEFAHTLQKMLTALCVLCRAGNPPRLGDDDGGRVFDPRRNRAEHMLDPLITGAVLYGRGDFKSVAGGLREETLWLLGEQGIAQFDRLSATDPVQDSVVLRAAGLYVCAHDEPKQQLVVDAGSQGAMTAGHGHADALAVCVNSQGRAVLIDPGTFEYVGENSGRNEFRGTRAHNTLLVDGRDQAEPGGPFSWTKLPAVRAENWISGKSFDLFVGSHDGYRRLENPVIHRRWIFSLKSKFWVVRDLALGSGEHELDLFWHLNPSLSAHKGEVDEGLRVLAAEGHGWSRDLREGWWSPVYGRKERMDVLHFATRATLPSEFVTLLMPVVDSTSSAGTLAQVRQSSGQESVAGYRYRSPEEEHWFCFGEGKAWTLGPWASDAEFLYWGASHDHSLRRLICCNATYVEANSQKVVFCPRHLIHFEIVVSGEQVNVFSSDNDTIVNKAALPAVSPEFEPALIDSLRGSKRTES
jgi:Heparinase II/III-like protein/Heparinase II/III N-terminus